MNDAVMERLTKALNDLRTELLGVVKDEQAVTRQHIYDQQEMTRQHVSNSLGSLAHETEVSKGLLYELRNGMSTLIVTITAFVRKLH